jgi:hypothetical protein
MSNQNVLLAFDNSFRSFKEAIVPLSDEQFKSDVNGRTVRDIVAHLVGWNGLMIEASISIMEGNTPSYFADAKNDYSNINAGFMAKYSSQSKLELLAELESTKEKFEAFILSLPAEELTADHNVKHYSGEPATVARIIHSLAGDYQYHAREIAERFGNQET